MQISDLFESGMSFDQFISTDEESYREKSLKTLESIDFEKEYIEKIKSIDKNINILVCGEIWCADCMLNIPVVEKMRKYNDKIKVSIVNKDMILESNLNLEKQMKLPTFIIYDEEFNELGIFTEYPKKIKEIIEDGNESNFLVNIRKYRKGGYAQETLKDILEIIDRGI